MKKYLFVVLLLGTVSACDNFFESTLEVDPPEHTPQMTVHAYLMDNDTAIGVSVGRSFGVLETVDDFESHFLDGANVEIYQQGDLKYTLSPVEEIFTEPGFNFLPINYGIVLSEPLGGIGDSFEIRVSHPDYGTIRAVQTIPAPVGVTSAVFEEDGGIGGDTGERTNIVDITFTDPPGTGQFYEIAVVKYNLDFFEYYAYYSHSADPNIEEGDNNLFLLSDLAIDGREYTVRIELDAPFEENMHVAFRTVSEDWYLYSKSINAFKASDDFGFFAEPVTVHSNIENGLGIFAAGTEVIFPVSE